MSISFIARARRRQASDDQAIGAVIVDPPNSAIVCMRKSSNNGATGCFLPAVKEQIDACPMPAYGVENRWSRSLLECEDRDHRLMLWSAG